MQLPEYLQIEPVGMCNLRCEMCPIQFRQDGPPYGPPAFMPFEHYTQLIDQFDGLKELHLQGLGEPMMHPRFFDMVRYAAERGIRVSTNSNLTLLSVRRAALCISSGLDAVSVSLDAASAPVFEKIRVKANFNKVVRNIDRLVAARAQSGGQKPEIRLVMVAMQQNLHELPELIELAHAHGINALFVQHLCHDFGEQSLPDHYRPMRQFVESQTLLNDDPARIAHLFTVARETAHQLGVELRLPRTSIRQHPHGTPGRERCDWPWRGAYVAYNGLSMPCCMIATPDRFNFGNMVAEGVQTVWQGEAYETFRARLSADTPPDICSTCAIYNGTF